MGIQQFPAFSIHGYQRVPNNEDVAVIGRNLESVEAGVFEDGSVEGRPMTEMPFSSANGEKGAEVDVGEGKTGISQPRSGGRDGRRKKRGETGQPFRFHPRKKRFELCNLPAE